MKDRQEIHILASLQVINSENTRKANTDLSTCMNDILLNQQLIMLMLLDSGGIVNMDKLLSKLS